MGKQRLFRVGQRRPSVAWNEMVLRSKLKSAERHTRTHGHGGPVVSGRAFTFARLQIGRNDSSCRVALVRSMRPCAEEPTEKSLARRPAPETAQPAGSDDFSSSRSGAENIFLSLGPLGR